MSLAPHERKTVTFRVTAPYTGILGLHATAACADCGKRDAKLRVGTFEAVEIVGEGDAKVAKQ